MCAATICLSEEPKYRAGSSGIADAFESVSGSSPDTIYRRPVLEPSHASALESRRLSSCLDAVVNVFGELLRVVVQPLYFAVDVGQFPPAVHPGELCRAGVPIVKDIFQTESRFGIVLQGFERHVLDEMGWQSRI